MNIPLHELAQLVDGTIVGDAQCSIHALAPIDHIEAGSLVLAEGVENFKKAIESPAAALLVSKNIETAVKPLIQVAHPYKAFITLLQFFYKERKAPPGVHPTAVIAEDATLGDNVSIGPYVVIESGATIGANTQLRAHVFIGQSVTIGEDCCLHPHVTVYENSVLGNRVSIHASTVIGSDGFGYKFIEGQHLKMPHVGHVRIEDDVEIGANTVVDRATLGATVIGEGTKIDNLVQIAHSVRLGKHNLLCAFTGIAGSTQSGDHVVFAANVGVSDHVRIDDGVILGARTGVPPHKHLLAGNVYLGNPARPREKALQQELAVTRIPIMRKNLKALTEKVQMLSAQRTPEENE